MKKNYNDLIIIEDQETPDFTDVMKVEIKDTPEPSNYLCL